MSNDARLIDHPDVIAALGDGPTLTPTQERLLGILLDPANDAAGYFSGLSDDDIRADMLDQYEHFAGEDSDTLYNAGRIADTYRTHLEREDAKNTGKPYGDTPFHFGYQGNADSEIIEIPMYDIGVYLGHDTGSWLTDSHDTKYLRYARTAHPGSGLRVAIELAEIITDDYQRVLGKAQRLGLLPAPPSRPVWPDTDEERAAFADWQYEVGNGDTAAAFRDWYDARSE